MSRQIATMIHNGIYKVIYEEGKMNPYKIVRYWREVQYTPYKCMDKQKTLVRYADLQSAMWYLYRVTCGMAE